MLANAKAVLDLHNIDLIEVSRETFTDTDEIFRFRTLAVDQNVATDDQAELFNVRGDAEPNDLVIYFVRTSCPGQTTRWPSMESQIAILVNLAELPIDYACIECSFCRINIAEFEGE